MKTIGIYYGSSTGTTTEIAHRIGEALGVDEAHIRDVDDFSSNEFMACDVLLLGSSTWGDGDLQDDWYGVIEKIKDLDLSGKQVGLFGCGDVESYPDSFCSAVGILYEELQGTGCEFIGALDNEGYSFDDTHALVDGHLVGLLLDEDNEGNLTDSRIETWVDQLKTVID